MVKGVVVGLQTLEQEPHEVSSPNKEGTTMLASPLPPFKLPQIIPQKNSLQMSSFVSFDKPSLKVPYHKSRTFQEWKTMFQNEWESILILDELFNWSILVFGSSKAQIRHQDQVPCPRIDSLYKFEGEFSPTRGG